MILDGNIVTCLEKGPEFTMLSDRQLRASFFFKGNFSVANENNRMALSV